MGDVKEVKTSFSRNLAVKKKRRGKMKQYFKGATNLGEKVCLIFCL